MSGLAKKYSLESIRSVAVGAAPLSVSQRNPAVKISYSLLFHICTDYMCTEFYNFRRSRRPDLETCCQQKQRLRKYMVVRDSHFLHLKEHQMRAQGLFKGHQEG